MLKMKELTLEGLNECIVLSIDSSLADSVSFNPHGVSVCIALEMRDIKTGNLYGKSYIGIVLNPTGNCQIQSIVMMENILYALKNIAVDNPADKKVIGALFLTMLNIFMSKQGIIMKLLSIIDVKYVIKEEIQGYFSVKMLNKYISSNGSEMCLGLMKN